jgi:hypothetical protein
VEVLQEGQGELGAADGLKEEQGELQATEELFLHLSLPSLGTHFQSGLHWSGFERGVCVKPRQHWDIAEPVHRDQIGAASRV